MNIFYQLNTNTPTNGEPGGPPVGERGPVKPAVALAGKGPRGSPYFLATRLNGGEQVLPEMPA